MSIKYPAIVAAAILLAATFAACQQPRMSKELARGEARQVPDTAFVGTLRVARIVPPGAAQPVAVIDQAHHNFHTASGRYHAFAQLLERAGLSVQGGTAPLSGATLASTRLLVIANALNGRQVAATDWALPTLSAFTPAEVSALRDWVQGGGSLLLIADHMPFPGAVTDLALAFGIHFTNSFALPPAPPDPVTGDYLIVFRRSDGGLTDNAITDGASPDQRVDSVTTFTGSSFWIDSERNPTVLLRLPPRTRIVMPRRSWQMSDSDAVVPGDRAAQGAVFQFGKGRVAVFGEAAMFSAQVKGPEKIPMGMNAPIAGENPRFIVNLVRWLLVTPPPSTGLHDASPHPPRLFDPGVIEHLVMAGWTGRDAAALESHVRELEALGVPRPTHTPVFYPVAASLLTTGDVIQVVGTHTSGEVEFVVAFLDGDVWVGLGSDQTDRAVERTSVALSKQLCAKVVAPMLWRFRDVEPHWDQLVLRAWAHRGERRELYQEDTLAAIRPPMQLLALYQDAHAHASAEAMPASWALFGGTIAAVHGVAPADELEMELHDPVLGRTLRHRYRIATLPENS